MARKSLSAFDVKAAEFISVADYQYEVGMEMNAKQDGATREAILKVFGVLKQHCTGCDFEVTEDELDRALWVIAFEIVKDMALLGIRLADFEFPDNMCVKCGEEV